MTLRIVVAEDSFLMREGITEVLHEQEGIEVVAVVGDYHALLRAVERERPDVVLTDIRMPPSFTDEGIRLAATLRADHPRIGVVVLSNYANPMYALALRRHMHLFGTDHDQLGAIAVGQRAWAQMNPLAQMRRRGR